MDGSQVRPVEQLKNFCHLTLRLWNTINDEIKLSTSLEKFKKKYVARMVLTVHASFAMHLVLFTFN